MTTFPYLFFNQTPERLRRIGARGGKARARNRRSQAPSLELAQPTAAPPPAQTAAQAIAALDAQFPWLCGAERRQSPKSSPHQRPA